MSLIFLQRLGEAQLLSSGALLRAEAVQWIGAASELVAAAREEAQAIVALARAEADAIRDRAREEGMRAGLEQGQSDLAAQLAGVAAAAGRYVRDIEPALIDAVMVAVGKLIGENGSAALMERAVLHVHQRLAEVESLTLRVPSALRATAEEAAGALTNQHGLLLPIRIEVDGLLQGEQCVIESSAGRAELRFPEQLERLRRVLGEAFEQASDAA
jgi:type III secretion protein L